MTSVNPNQAGPWVSRLCTSICGERSIAYVGSEARDAVAAAAIGADEAGLVDWISSHDGTGAGLLERLCCEGSMPDGVVAHLASRYGAGFLTQPGSSAVPLFDIVWKTTLARRKKNDSRKGMASEQHLVEWVEQLPLDALRRYDKSGETPGSGWLWQALRADLNQVADALLRRGASMDARHSGYPIAMATNTTAQWQSFLECGGDATRTGVHTRFADMPLWEALLWRIGSEHKHADLRAAVLDDAQRHAWPGHDVHAHWFRLARGLVNLDLFVQARPQDWHALRDRHGRNALQVAGTVDPKAWRTLAIDKKDRHGLMQKRDAYGHGAMFYAWPQMDDRTWSGGRLLAGMMARGASASMVDPKGDGLVGQMFRDMALTRTLTGNKVFVPSVTGQQLLIVDKDAASAGDLWRMSPETQDKMIWLLDPGNAARHDSWAHENLDRLVDALALSCKGAGRPGMSADAIPRLPVFDAMKEYKPCLRGLLIMHCMTCIARQAGSYRNASRENGWRDLTRFLDVLAERSGWELPQDHDVVGANALLIDSLSKQKSDTFHYQGGLPSDIASWCNDWRNEKFKAWQTAYAMRTAAGHVTARQARPAGM